jgi:hypothetical protein
MILTLCQRGAVRSATCAAILRDCFGQFDVVATGIDTTTPGVMLKLCEMADRILIVGDSGLVNLFNSEYPEFLNYSHIDVGVDVWMMPMKPSLVEAIIQKLLAAGWDANHVPIYGSISNYIAAVHWAWENHH